MTEKKDETPGVNLKLIQLGNKIINAKPAELDDPALAVPPSETEDGPEDAGAGGDTTPPPIKPIDGTLPEACPVEPLGKEGTVHYYLDALHQLVMLPPREHSRNHIASLFAPRVDYLKKHWPKKVKIKEKDANGDTIESWAVTGFKVDECADDLMTACARRGVWNPKNSLRGLGAWPEKDGLVFHCGDVLWTADKELNTGWHGQCVYPALKPIPKPWHDVVECGTGSPGSELLDTLKTWNWERGSLDAELMLGWIAASFLGGALDWRPMAFLTGDTSTGKSTLQKIIKAILGEELIESADTTEAALSQTLGYSSIPIAIDELEASEDNRQALGVIKLARIASSGAIKRRGGANHQSSEFKIQSCFLFGAILMPPLEPQDRTRMAILRLKPLLPTQEAPIIAREYYREMGRKLKRRLADQWYRFDGTLQEYHNMLIQCGHNSRAANQFSVLLACANLVLAEDRPTADELESLATQFDVRKWAETLEIEADAVKCIEYLSQIVPEAGRGGGSKASVAELVSDLNGQPSGVGYENPHRKVLAAAGLGYVFPRSGEKANARSAEGRYLAVPLSHQLLNKLFQGTKWGTIGGSSGGWVEALRRLDGAKPNSTARIAGRACKCVLVPVELVTNRAFKEDLEKETQSHV